ncbi:conserved hypothetical protein [Alistipes timonensis JC136]|uniref:Mucoidy inhibitor MuiA family protein n=1 Tax=Alistipes timonensis JC136 TaxID=1033731 RepID=A0A1H4C3N2_9BACT|nr:DUF4139 domain-containing protein [Alistipes timonensis]SEA54893.1 conserved hypothetical protein [Alistipes timonensis JC136]
MTRLNCIAWLLLSICAAAAAPVSGQTKVKTSVEKVTLFIDGAQVTRTEQVDIPAGNSTLVFTGLSPYLDDKSMQVAAKGRFTVTAVNRLFNHTDSLERSARQQALEQELANIRQQQKKQQAAREVIDAESDLLKVNCSVGNRNAATPLTAIKELNEYYTSRMEELKRRTLELEGQLKTLSEREQQVLADLTQLGGRQTAPMSEVEVRIESPAACKGVFTLTYYVRNAGWFPSYDIRSGGLSEPVEISYKANIFQNTREEWKNVALTLSSSNPTTGSIAPQLKTWWLDYGMAPPRYNPSLTSNTVSGTVFDEQREPLIGASVLVPGTTVGTSTDVQGRYSVTVPNGASSLQFNYIGYKSQTRAIAGNTMNVVMQEDNAQLDEVVVTGYGSAPSAALTGRVAGVQARNKAATRTVEMEFADFAEESDVMEVGQTQTQLGYEFEIRQPYTIPSDGKSVAAEIGRYRLPAVYTYRSTPKIDKDAFLVAETTDWAKLNLLEGEANVYFENTFVGKSILSPREAGDTLRFSMGRDRGIRIERTKESDYSARRAVGSNQTQTMGWKLTVRNTRTEPVVLMLTDQLPVSRNSSITVTEEELSGGTLDKETGTVTWRLELKPGEQRELKLRYAVKYPKGRSLNIE